MRSFALLLVFTLILSVLGATGFHIADGKGQAFVIVYEGVEYDGSYLITGTGSGTVENVNVGHQSIKATVQSEFDAQLILIVSKEILNATEIVYYSTGNASGVLEYITVPEMYVDGEATGNYTARISQSVISFTVSIGAGIHEIEIAGTSASRPMPGIGYLAPMKEFKLLDMSGNEIKQVEVGQQAIITATIQSIWEEPRPIVLLFEIRDSDGITTYLTWHRGILDSGESYTTASSWTPTVGFCTVSGTEECSSISKIRVFAISALNCPQVLSDVYSLDGIIVTDYSQQAGIRVDDTQTGVNLFDTVESRVWHVCLPPNAGEVGFISSPLRYGEAIM